MARAPQRRAFTIAELLIALALILALGALVLPNLSGYSADSAFTDACERLKAAGAFARARAIERGEAVELIARTGSDGVTRILARSLGSTGAIESDGSIQPAPALLLAELPTSIRFGADPSSIPESSPPPDPDPKDQADNPVVLLVLFMPDGTAADRGGFLFDDRAGRWARASVRPLAGVLEFTRVFPRQADAIERPEQDGPGKNAAENPEPPPVDPEGLLP